MRTKEEACTIVTGLCIILAMVGWMTPRCRERHTKDISAAATTFYYIWCTYDQLMKKNTWTFSTFHCRVCHPHDDEKWKRMFEIVSRFPTVTVSEDILLEKAEEEFERVLQFCLDDHKVCVKVIEMYHWCYNQDCGYGSNRQHQMWWSLDMDAGIYNSGNQRDWGLWQVSTSSTLVRST